MPSLVDNPSAPSSQDPGKVVRVGIAGCGEIAQVAHIPTLNFLSDIFQITYLFDVSQDALAHCANKIPKSAPRTTTDIQKLCASSDVDAVLVCTASAFHTRHAVAALQHGKHVLVEKPLALSYRDLEAIETAERASPGRVFVGYMRRYAPALQDAIAELGDAEIQYARVRDIIGPNADFVNQSGTFAKKLTDFPAADVDELKQLDLEVAEQALCNEFGVPCNADTRRMLGILGGLGTHDLSAMREVLGVPLSVRGSSLQTPIFSAIFQYQGFSVVYESGINNVTVFDAHIEIYTANKIVRVSYDTPYVKGLPTTMTVRERATGPRGEECYQERFVRTTYEDAYTIEFREWYKCMTEGKAIKTTVSDARNDLDIMKMLLQDAFGNDGGR